MKKLKDLLFVAIVSTALATPVYSHSGGTDSNGCHSGTEARHCHNDQDDNNNDTALNILGVLLLIIGVKVAISQQSAHNQVVEPHKKVAR